MSKIDIYNYKKGLRKKYIDVRKNMNFIQKHNKNINIFNRLTAMKKYKEAKLVLTFVSKPIEVDTHKLIQNALNNGKKVAVPYCVPGTALMEFYYITSLKNLSEGAFGVLEPEPDDKNLVKNFNNSISIIPGLSFDYQGYRLGYGKGYYDRFISKYKGYNIGICYNCCMAQELPHGHYDKAVDIIVTEKFVKNLNN